MLAVLSLLWLSIASAVWADDVPAAPVKKEAEGKAVNLEELQRRLNIISEELDEVKSGGGSGGASQGFRTNVFGYGEMHYNRFTDKSSINTFDNHRFVLGVFSRISDWIQLNAELDYEHAGQEVEFELGYLDFLLSPKFNFRAGVVLIPIGFLNEYHEPNLYWTVERPQIQTNVIPTSWSGGGAGVWGTPLPGFNYRIYMVNSLQSVRPSGFSAGSGIGNGGNSGRFNESSGIRGGRLQLNNAIGDDVAFTGRFEYSNTKYLPGTQLGFSFYTGETTHDVITTKGGRTSLFEGDIKYRRQWFEANATLVNIDINNALELNTFARRVGTANGVIPERIWGWNVQGGIHLLQAMGRKTIHDIVPFYMFEKFDLHAKTPTGFTNNPLRDTEVHTWGIAYLPVPQVSLKLDFQNFNFDNNTHLNQLNMAVSYLY
jgi:hypothetical protein